tara:strand:- start:398 stop:982 length:585 start_codon:yes stop_codon:yes gene_type:complete
MVRIFGDAIDDKIFPKKIKRFTQEEKDLIEKFVNSILRNDKKSELEKSEITQFNDRLDGITEEIYKYFIFKKSEISLRFSKYYTNEKKKCDYLTEFALDGRNYFDGSPSKSLLKEFEKDKSITGIYVKGFYKADLEFILESVYPKEYPKTEELAIRTRYEDVKSGGYSLTKDCKTRIEKVHFKIIKNAILKAVK